MTSLQAPHIGVVNEAVRSIRASTGKTFSLQAPKAAFVVRLQERCSKGLSANQRGRVVLWQTWLMRLHKLKTESRRQETNEGRSALATRKPSKACSVVGSALGPEGNVHVDNGR